MEKENKIEEDIKDNEEPCCSEDEMKNRCPKPQKKMFKCSCGGWCS